VNCIYTLATNTRKATISVLYFQMTSWYAYSDWYSCDKVATGRFDYTHEELTLATINASLTLSLYVSESYDYSVWYSLHRDDFTNTTWTITHYSAPRGEETRSRNIGKVETDKIETWVMHNIIWKKVCT
jgi:hypothetical protein